MNILITGGMGYIGSQLVYELLKDERNFIYIVDLMIYKNKLPLNKNNLKVIKDDIRGESCRNILKQGIDIVYHFAGVSNDPGNGITPEEGMDINYNATINLYKDCLKFGVKRFIYPSSCSVYGRQNIDEGDTAIYLNENSNVNPITNYAIAKRKVENYILQNNLNTNMCVTIVRPATVYGWSYRQRFDLIVNKSIAEIYYKKSVTVSDKRNIRPTIHIKDLIDLYILLSIVEIKKINNEIFNLAYDNLSIENICEKIFEELDINVKIHEKKEKESRSYYVTSEKVEKVLGFKRRFSLEHGIREMKQSLLNCEFDDIDINRNYFNRLCQPIYFAEV